MQVSGHAVRSVASALILSFLMLLLLAGCGGGGGTPSTGTSPVWTWVSGSSHASQVGSYGTEGVPAAGNVPGSRSSGANWVDAKGDLWLFGGNGLVQVEPTAWTAWNFNDLWEYSLTTGTWTWVGGSNYGYPVGIDGTQGVPSTSNIPPSRSRAASWSDSNGNFWLFGGETCSIVGTNPVCGLLNDLWEYSPSANTWTWVSGSSATNAIGVYGSRGVTDSNSLPGARSLAVSWTDANGNFWLFGGSGMDSTNGAGGDLNDLWEYSPSGKTWTWVGGSNLANAQGVYGVKGVASSSNMPSSRWGSVGWADASGNLWLFGGNGFDSTGAAGGELNDLWEYNTADMTWNWVSGSNVANAIGTYGTLGTASVNNVPGARWAAGGWVDASGHLLLFGGAGWDSSGVDGLLNDLWEYSPADKTWTWKIGSNTANVYGTYDTTDGNIPGSRAGSFSWADHSGKLWLFAGQGYASVSADQSEESGNLNDLWSYEP